MSIELEQQLQACQAENQNLRRQLEQKTKVAARALASYQQRALHMEIIRQQNEDLDRLAASLTQAKQLAEDHVHQAEAVAQRLALANAALEKEIIERKRAEEILAKRTAELEDASSFLDSIVENIPIMIVVKDAQDLKFVRWNKYGEKLVGVDQKDFIGKSDYDFFPKEEADFFTAKDREVLAGGKLIDIPEEPIQIATGETRLLHTQKVPIFGADGKPKYLLAIAEDITERKQAEEILKIRNLAIESAIDSITVADARQQDMPLIYVNPAFERITGYTSAEVIGRNCRFLQRDDRDQPALAELRAALKAGRECTVVLRNYRKDGTFFWNELQMSPVRNEDGVVTHFIGVQNDITVRKQTEETILRGARELETVARVGTAAATILEIDKLLQEVVDLTKSSFNFYHAHVYLLNQAQDTLVLAAGAGKIGRRMVKKGWSIPLNREHSLVAQAARTRQGVIVNDVRQEPDFLPNPLLPETRAEMAIPLIVGEQMLGVLDVQANEVGRFTEEDVRLKTILAGQIAVALQNARSFAEQQQAQLMLTERVNELNCLNEIGREITETPPVPEFLQWVTERIPPAMRYPALCRAAIEYNGQVYGSPEAIELPCQIVHALRIGSEVMGRVYIAYTEKREFLDEESALIGGIAGRISGYIESRRLLEQTQEAQAESELLYSMANQLIQAADPAELLEAASRYARRLGASGGTLLYMDNDPQGNPEWSQIIAQWSALNESSIPTGTRFYLPEFPLSKLWISHPNQPLLISDVLTDERVDPVTRKLLAQAQSNSFALVPLNIKGRWVGLLSFNWNEPYSFTKHDQRIFGTIAQQTVSVVDAVRASLQTQEALAETRILYETSQVLGAATNMDEALQGILLTLNQNGIAIGADSVTLTILEVDDNGEPDQTEIAAWWFADNREPPYPIGTRFPTKGLTLTDLWTKDPSRPIFLSDTRTDEQLDDLTRSWYVQAGTLASVLMPLHLAGRWVGQLSISWTEPHQFSEQHQHIYRALMRQFAVTVDNQRLAQQTQVALAENQQQKEFLGKIINILPVGLFAKDVKNDFRFSIWNAKMEELLGIKAEDMLGKSDYDYSDKEQADFYRKMDLAAIEAGQAIDIPVEEITTNQGIRLAHTTKLPLYDSEGKPETLLVILEDITDRKQAEEALRENEGRLSEALAAARLAHWEFDVATQVFTFNDRFYALLHTTAEQEGGYLMPAMQYAQKFVHPDDAYLVGVEIEKALKAIEPNFSSQVEHRIIRADGSEGYVFVTFKVLRDEQGRTVKTVGASQDITERKRADEALRDSEARQRALLNAIPDLIMRLSGDGTYLDIKVAKDFPTLVPPEQLIGKNSFAVLPLELAQQRQSYIELALKTGEIQSYEHQVQRSDRIAYEEIRVIPSGDNEVLMTVRDISERKQAEAERERLLAEVEVAYRQYVHREWEEFLKEQHQGNLHIEHELISRPAEPATQTLDKIQDEVIREGKTKVINGAGDNGQEVEPAIVAPIALRGEVIGTLSLQDIAPDRQWTDEEMALVQTVSEQLALTLENLRLYDETQRAAWRDRVISESTAKVWSSVEIEGILQAAVAQLGDKLRASEVVIRLGTETELIQK